MSKWFFLLIFILIYTTSIAQRNRGLSELTPAEIEQKRIQDSIAGEYNKFERDFDLQRYLIKVREIKKKNDSIQLNETLEFLKENEAKADTLTSLTIQSSTLSVFPQSIKNYKNLRVLTLRRCQSVHLEDLFEKIKDLPKLETLNIIFSGKSQLPNNISLLKKVKHLNLESNKLLTLPETMSGMTSLVSINLHNNSPLDPENVFNVLSQVGSLKEINFSGCKLFDLPSNIGKMNQIEELNLSTNAFKEIPDEVSEMKSLKKLNLSYNQALNPLTTMNRLGKISSLEDLNLFNCKITEIPATIGTLTHIKSLNLLNNPISKVHPEIGSLVQLEELQIGSDFMTKERVVLKSLPAQIGNCKQLKKLNLPLCSIEEIPAQIEQLEQLEYLDMSWNKLKEFPLPLTKLKNLKYLDLSINSIHALPSSFGTLTESLETFLLAANFNSHATTKIQSLPTSIGTLSKLKVLSLKDQVYETIPDNFWDNCTQVEDLNLMGALLQEIPSGISKLTSLKTLNVKGNEIKRVSEEFKNLKQLENLNFAFNPELNYSDLFTLLRQMPQIKHLDISYNDLKRDEVDALAASMPKTKIICVGITLRPDRDIEEKKKK